MWPGPPSTPREPTTSPNSNPGTSGRDSPRTWASPSTNHIPFDPNATAPAPCRGVSRNALYPDPQREQREGTGTGECGQDRRQRHATESLRRARILVHPEGSRRGHGRPLQRTTSLSIQTRRHRHRVGAFRETPCTQTRPTRTRTRVNIRRNLVASGRHAVDPTPANPSVRAFRETPLHCLAR